MIKFKKIEETYIKKDEVIFVDKGKSVYAVQNSTINFAKLLSKDILKNLQRQSQKIQVEELENYLQQLNEHKQTENITQHIQVFQNELQKKYIEQNISDEDILVKNYGLIQHIKNQVRCTDKKNIEQIFVGVYRRKYQIIKYLTSGGQADILIGKYINDQGQDTEYVIRITSSDEDTFNYIKEEYELVKKFKKANNIIEYYDSIYFEDINTGVFIVEKCSQSLTEVLRGKRNGYTNFNELEICQIVFDLVQGLIDMRSHNILHQDIKPDNILVNKDGNYVFSDFGCSSKFLDGLAENKGFTMKYCAPEQLIEEYFTNYKADIYQLGRTIQQILEFYEKQGGVQTKFIKDLNQIIFNNMIQESQEKRKECIDIFALLCDLVIENNYKSFIEKLAGKIKKQLEGQQMSIEKETRFYLDQQIKYHFILLQIKFYQQDGYILLIQNKSKQQILSEIWNKISKDLFLLNEGENQNQQQLQLPQNIDILHGYFSSLSDLAECYFQNNEDEDCFFIGQLLLKISEKTNHNNIDHLLDAIQLLQKQLYKSINLSKYIKYIEDLEDSKQDQNIFKILASEYYHKDINKSFYFSLKLYAYYYKQYVQFSESDDQQDGDLIVYHGYYYLNSLLNLTNIFSEWEMDEVVQGNMQFIRQASHQLQLDKQFEKQYSTFGVQFFNLKQYNKAITFFEHELSREIENSKENKIKSNLFIIYKFKIGECYHKQSKFEQANQIFMELLQIFEQNIYQKDFVNNNFIKIQTLFHVGYYNFQKKKYMNAIIYFTELLQFLKNDIQKETNFYKLYYPNCLHYLGICYCQEETYDKEESTTYLKKFLDSLKDKDINGLEQDQKKQIYVSLHTLGYFNFEEENFKESEYYFTKLLKSFAQTTDYDDELFNNCLRYLLSSIVYQDQTQDSFYHKFIDIIIETVQFKAITDEKSKADILKNIKMGFKYSSYLESEDEKFLKNAELISILENLELEETEEYVMVQNYQAFIMFENGQYEESIIYYQKTLPIMKKIFSYPNQYVAIVQSSLGMAQHQLKQFQIAIIYYEQALNTMKDLKYYENNQTHQDMITCIDRILICFNGFGNNLQALKFYRNFENIIPVLYSQSHSTTIKFNKQYETCKKILADQNQTQKQNI